MSRIVMLSILLALAVPVIGTQVVVHMLHYPAWMGAPLVTIGRLWLYAPWSVGVWYWRYAWYYPVPFEWAVGWMSAWMIGSGVLVARLLKQGGWSRQTGWSRQIVPPDVDWAGPKEIRKAHLFIRVRK
jgi:hypothetical protein